MKTQTFNRITFTFAALCIAGCFFLAYLPRKAGSQVPTAINGLSLMEDKTAALTIEDIPQKNDAFQAVNKSSVFHKRSTSAFWLKFTVSAPPAGSGERYLEINNPSLESIDVFFPDQPVIHAGKMIPIRNIALKTRVWNILIPANLPAESAVYVRVQSTTIMWVPFRVVSTSDVITKSIGETLLFGYFFGILMAIFFVNLFSFMIIKNRNFLFYMLYLGSLIVYNLRIHGFVYYLPISYQVQNIVVWLSLGGVGIFMILFAKQFLDLKKRAPAINRVLSVGILAFVVQTGFGLLQNGYMANQIAYITGFLVPLIIILTTAKIYLCGYHEARYYLLAWCAMFTGTLIWSTSAYAEAQIPASYFFVIGTSIDSLLFTLAIFDLIKNALIEKEEIVEREKYYIDLSRTDSLTGLYNRRHLTDIVKRLEANNELSGECALIMLDLDHFKEINDTHGHLIGDMLLTKLGSKIKKHIRKTDIACRYGGDEFLILLPNANLTAANNIAEEIRREILEDFCLTDTGERVQNTVSIGITVNRVSDSFDGLFLRADAALYQAKKTGRNRISVL